jgi:hypothetical protein
MMQGELLGGRDSLRGAHHLLRIPEAGLLSLRCSMPRLHPTTSSQEHRARKAHASRETETDFREGWKERVRGI